MKFLLVLSAVNALSFKSTFTPGMVGVSTPAASNNAMKMEYIPSGMTKAQWAKMKEAEKNKNKGKNLGANGIQSFQSRSLDDWQKAGGKNLFPVDPRKVKNVKDLPYMQRPGGKADGSDLLKKGPIVKKPLFKFGGKAAPKAAAPPPPPPKKKNFWDFQ
ncbi:hypothetical protein ScalyP_jg11703 [Parmales sp. scaly parma]|nr:hypothetical protein ScalyP_jg11703 [Parmales sp. scaly parma]